MDICGFTCQEVMNIGAKNNLDGCKFQPFITRCKGVNPPEGFAKNSSLQELCPNTCQC